jgi:nucleotide-binding universal stress UspA family protein
MQLVVVATDGSESGDRAVRTGAMLAAACSARLHIATVEEPKIEARNDVRALGKIEGGVGEVVDSIANNILHDARRIAERQGLSGIETEIYWGTPATVIQDAAERLDADIVVVGRRGRTRFAGMLLGSVSQKLVSASARPVLVVP